MTSLKGKTLRTESGIEFTVHKDRFYPNEAVSKQHIRYLSELDRDLLVSISFYGNPVPVVTVEGGVVRLQEITVGENRLTGTHEISHALGVSNMRTPTKVVAI